MRKLAFSDHAMLEVVRMKENGGAVVKMRVAVATYDIDSSLTAGGGEDSFDLTIEMLHEMVRNFEKVPGPIAIYKGHISSEERRETPAYGYVEALEVQADTLVATLDLPPASYAEMVEQEGFRGASIEFTEDLVLPTTFIEGWVFVGLAITNSPALDVHNKVAAGAAPINRYHHAQGQSGYVVRLSVRTEGAKEQEFDMTLEQLNAKLEELQAANKALEAERDELKAKVDELTVSFNDADAKVRELSKKDDESADVLRARSREYGKLANENAELKERLEKLESRDRARDILEVVDRALEEGKVTPAEVNGYAKDPVKWLAENYGEAFTPAMLEVNFSKRPVVVNTRDRKASGVTSDAATSLTRDEQDALRELGIDPALAQCDNADQARRLAKKQS